MAQTVRSMKNPEKFATSLTDMTQAELASLQQQQQMQQQQKQEELVGAAVGEQ